jgi:hypothetical protein
MTWKNMASVALKRVDEHLSQMAGVLRNCHRRKRVRLGAMWVLTFFISCLAKRAGIFDNAMRNNYFDRNAKALPPRISDKYIT